MKSLSGNVQHNRRIFANRVQKDGVFAFGNNLAKNVNALGFEPLEVRQGQTFVPVIFTTMIAYNVVSKYLIFIDKGT